VIVHPSRLGAGERQRWAQTAHPDVLRPAAEGPDFLIFEIVDREDSGVWTEGLLAETPGATTLTGLSRARIDPPAQPGRIEVTGPLFMRYELDTGLDEYTSVRLENPSDGTWPGLDIHPQGLVRLRYRFYDAAGDLVHEGDSGFDRDLPGGRTVTAVATVTPPARTGRFRVVYDVVQVWDGERRDLGFAPVERKVEVIERKRLPGGDS